MLPQVHINANSTEHGTVNVHTKHKNPL